MSYELKHYLNSVNHTKENLMDSDDPMWEKKYPAYVAVSYTHLTLPTICSV